MQTRVTYWALKLTFYHCTLVFILHYCFVKLQPGAHRQTLLIHKNCFNRINLVLVLKSSALSVTELA